ncbi:NAD(P)H-binding protein [Enterococcus hermanniensis]|nr:NAD(P)H-binding protein [Enterococcus hermanniensis]
MKITLLGSLGNINRNLVPQLIEAGHDVTVITSRQEGVKPLLALGAKAALGTNTDSDFLTRTFEGSDVVYLMISSKAYSPTETSMLDLADIYSQAIRNSGVKKVINLSSVGAQTPEAGILYQYHYMEDALNAIEEVAITHIRPMGFYTNHFSELETINSENTIYEAIASDTKRAWVDPADIADCIFQEILNLHSNQTVSSVKYVVSDWATGQDWIDALAENGLTVKYIKITIDTLIANFMEAGLPETVAKGFGQMARFQQTPDKLYGEITQSNYFLGKVKNKDFAKVFANIQKAQTSKNN